MSQGTYSYNFKGKVALVTGAAMGIGRATALAFAEHGAAVAIADISSDEGARTSNLINEAGGRAIFIKCDVASEADIKFMVEKTVSALGRLDYAFNNAGIEGAQAMTPDCTNENWNRVIAVNLTSVWLCMKYQIPVLLKQGGGAIVNCSSIAGLIGFPGSPAYVASKHGVIGLTKTAALEFAKQNIRVNAICPGIIQTPMIDRFTHGEAQLHKQLIAGEPVGRAGKPEEIAAAALWLCSDQSGFVTGHPLVVDGGWVAQ